MAGSWIEVANSALTKLGSPPITDFDENSRAAKLISLRQEACRNYVLSEHPWNCAIARVLMAPDAEAPAFGWTYQFTLPTECLRPLIPENLARNSYTMEGRKILANSDSIELRYVSKVADPAQLRDYLAEVVAWYLAFDTCYALTQDSELKKEAFDGYRTARGHAKFLDASENPNQRLTASHFLSGRLG